MAARAGGARELPPPPCPPPSAAAAAAAADAPFSHPPPALKLHGAGPGGGGLVGCGSQADGSASREAPYGGHESSPFAPDAPSLSPFASSTLPAFDGEAGQPAPQQQPQSPQRAAVGPPVLRAGLHPAASMTNESPFAALPAFADSDDEEPAAPALQAIAESSSGGLSSAPTIASSQPLASSSGQLAARLRMCQLSSSEDGSLEDPLQVLPAGLCTGPARLTLHAVLLAAQAAPGPCPQPPKPPGPCARVQVERCLPPGALARTQTLHQQMQEVAATRPPLYGPAHALARLGRPRSAGQLSPPGGEGVLERTCATAQGEGPASAGVAHAGRATSAATSPSKPGPSAAPVAEGAWASLEGAAL